MKLTLLALLVACVSVYCAPIDNEAILNDLIDFEDEVDDDGCPVGLTKAVSILFIFLKLCYTVKSRM